MVIIIIIVDKGLGYTAMQWCWEIIIIRQWGHDELDVCMVLTPNIYCIRQFNIRQRK